MTLSSSLSRLTCQPLCQPCRVLRVTLRVSFARRSVRPAVFATETDYGVVLADRVIWLLIDMFGQFLGRLTPVLPPAAVERAPWSVSEVRGVARRGES